MPPIFKQVCTPVTEHATKATCIEQSRRWHAENTALTNGVGIPHGLRIGLKLSAEFAHGGRVSVSFGAKYMK